MKNRSSFRLFSLNRLDWPRWLPLALLWSASGLAGASSPAENIRQALASGQLEQAAKLLQQEKPRIAQDVELRFLEGVVQAQQNQTDKAIETFRRLTETHPGMVEAHNNLGVLYASKGRLEEARKALEAGMHANASYAALHRNLSDVQSQLVRQTYAKALQVDSKARTAVAQLSLLASLQPRPSVPMVDPLPSAMVVTSRQPAGGNGAAASVVPAAPPMAPASAVPVVQPAIPTTRPAASAPPATASVPPPSQETATSRSSSQASEPAPATAARPVQATETEAVRAAVMAWAKAWSRKDVDDYLKAYGSNFAPPDGLSRSKWEAERKLRIVSKKSISVEVRQLKVTAENKTATVQFQQIYTSDNFTGTSRKTLEMVKQGDRWLITRERVN